MSELIKKSARNKEQFKKAFKLDCASKIFESGSNIESMEQCLDHFKENGFSFKGGTYSEDHEIFNWLVKAAERVVEEEKEQSDVIPRADCNKEKEELLKSTTQDFKQKLTEAEETNKENTKLQSELGNCQGTAKAAEAESAAKNTELTERLEEYKDAAKSLEEMSQKVAESKVALENCQSEANTYETETETALAKAAEELKECQNAIPLLSAAEECVCVTTEGLIKEEVCDAQTQAAVAEAVKDMLTPDACQAKVNEELSKKTSEPAKGGLVLEGKVIDLMETDYFGDQRACIDTPRVGCKSANTLISTAYKAALDEDGDLKACMAETNMGLFGLHIDHEGVNVTGDDCTMIVTADHLLM
jgi:myosin heavy subunit